MLNEKRIAAMAKMSIYSEGDNKKNLAICKYYKYDYITLNIIITLLWVAVIYAGVVLVGCVLNVEQILQILLADELYMFLVKIGISLLVIWTVFAVIGFWVYKAQYEKAQVNTQKYYKELYKLNRLYAKEEV